jgi:hypothetical protein
MELGIGHFSVGAYFAIAGYNVVIDDRSDKIGGFGYGGDFSVGYSMYLVHIYGSYSNNRPRYYRTEFS